MTGDELRATEVIVGELVRIGDATFEVTSVGPTFLYIEPRGGDERPLHAGCWGRLTRHILAAMGAVRIPPPLPPTIGVPQSVADNPPPPNTYVLAWTGSRWDVLWSSSAYASEQMLMLWMPMPAPPPGLPS